MADCDGFTGSEFVATEAQPDNSTVHATKKQVNREHVYRERANCEDANCENANKDKLPSEKLPSEKRFEEIISKNLLTSPKNSK